MSIDAIMAPLQPYPAQKWGGFPHLSFPHPQHGCVSAQQATEASCGVLSANHSVTPPKKNIPISISRQHAPRAGCLARNALASVCFKTPAG